MKSNTMRACALLPVMATFLIACGTPTTTPPAAGTPRPTRPGNSVIVPILTNNTKSDWLRQVTDAFNQARTKTANGQQILVEIAIEESAEAAVQKIAAGELQPVLWSPGDSSSVNQANQLRKDKGQGPIASEQCPSIVYVGTGFALWRPMAEALGWPDKPIGWRQIIELAGEPQGWALYGHPEWGQFTFGHSHPQYNTTGFNLMASLAYAAAGKTADLTPADVKSQKVVDAFRKVEMNTYRYGTSTTGLVNPMMDRGPTYLHAAMASETSVLWRFVHPSSIPFPLVFIFPAEGTYWMDNPTCILDASWVSPQQHEAAKIYRDYLLAPPAQNKAVEIGLRPVIAGVTLRCPICLEDGTDPHVSPQTVPPLQAVSGETREAIVQVFKETKKKATVVVVLDKSGSMFGDKLTNAIEATKHFISRLDPADRVQVDIFSYQVESLAPLSAVSDVRESVYEALGQLKASGRTALNDAICTAMESAQAARRRDRADGERRLYGIVLLTDGIEEGSEQQDPFACLPPKGVEIEMDAIKIFPIAYGKNADAKLLKEIAVRTDGRSSASEPATIEQIYLDISAEQ